MPKGKIDEECMTCILDALDDFAKECGIAFFIVAVDKEVGTESAGGFLTYGTRHAGPWPQLLRSTADLYEKRHGLKPSNVVCN